MSNKLLHKTLKIYILCSVVVLLVTAPIFYFSISQMYIDDIDDTLKLYKKEFKHNYLPNFKQSEIENWNRYNRDIKIEPSDATTSHHTKYFYKNFYDKLDDENEPYRVLQAPIMIEGKPYTLTAKISLVETEDLIENIAILFIVIIALLLIVLLIVTNRFSKIIWQPFRNTLEKLKSFDLTTQQNVSFNKTEIEEFEELNQSLQKLIDKNISVYNQQKTFIENASHELQTPLAVLKSKLDLLLQNKDLTNEQSEIINAIELPLSRVSRINKNLLLLAKIENNQFADKENIEVTELANETFELLIDYINAKQISVEKNFSEKLSVKCNKTLFEILISNLLINAIVHNTEKGKINIDFSESKLTISNTGKIALDSNKIFERFIVSSSKTTNSGLGLAIVKEICNRYHWKIVYQFKNGFHSFSVQF